MRLAFLNLDLTRIRRGYPCKIFNQRFLVDLQPNEIVHNLSCGLFHLVMRLILFKEINIERSYTELSE